MIRSDKWLLRWTRVVTAAAICGLAVTCGTAKAAPQSTAAAPAKSDLHIKAESSPYHFEFDDDQGKFVQEALGVTPERRYSVTYLYSQAGPTGYAKHLAWFLARDARGFAVMWCYLDDTGKDFWCWLYRFPDNLLTTQKFTGEYTFTHPPTTKETTEPGFNLKDLPIYDGPVFTYPGWTKKSGTIAKLDLFTPPVVVERAPTAVANRDVVPDQKPVRSLEALDVHPLHQLQVGAANGWRNGGWEELHAIAYDSAKDPYYLILYTNSTRGFAIDLKRGKTFTANFGSKVVFNEDQKEFGPKGASASTTEIPSVKRNQPYEMLFTSQKSYDNPYTDVFLDIELVGPDRRTIRIPGFWDGGKTWKLRFAPPKIGMWTWKTFSTDKDLDGKIGVVDCAPESDPTIGFLHVHPYRTHSRHFAIGQSTNFYPSYIFDPVAYDSLSGGAGVIGKTAAVREVQNSGAPASFTAFQARMDTLHAAGYNRLTGDFVISGDTATGEPKNEGGTPFLGGDLNRLNPEYFRWMEKRIAYSNSVGMVPDVGIAASPAIVFAAGKDSQLRALWRYMLARFSAYDICWDLFGPVPADSVEALARITPFAQMAGKYDLFHHPLTTQITVTEEFLKKGAAAMAPATNSSGSRIPSAFSDGPPLGLPMWLDVVTVKLADPKLLYGLEILKKPLVVVTDPGPGDDDARAALWGTRMRSGYFTSSAATSASDALNSPLMKAVSICDTFFKQTHYARLEPHMEMLAARDETPEQRRRRHLANIQAGIPVDTGAPVSAKDAAATPPAALVMSDPSREYVLYFQHGGNVTLDLLEATGHIKVYWLNPRTGEMKEDLQIVGGTYHAFSAPDDKDWVLFLKRV